MCRRAARYIWTVSYTHLYFISINLLHNKRGYFTIITVSYTDLMAGKIVNRGPVAVRLTKEAINEGLEMDLEKAFMHEADLFGLVFTSEGSKEGMAAFLEKRKPGFKNQ